VNETIVSLDIGGTNARFALAKIANGKVVDLDEPVTLKTDEFGSLQAAWQEFGKRLERKVPNAVAIAVAGPVGGNVVRMTNSPWIIQPALLREQLEVDDVLLINDFGAVAHAVAQLGPEHFIRLSGPDVDLPGTGRISIVGPGTGLGVAHVGRDPTGYSVQATEGGHVDFAPVDVVDDAILARLRKRHLRVSVERVVSGPAIVDIYEALAALQDEPVAIQEDTEIWTAGLAGEDPLAVAAIERFCMSLGSVAGDIALVQGGDAVVIAGGLGLRIKEVLARSAFATRFRAKGRYEGMMAAMPVKIVIHPQPGLYGAAAAFAQEHG
jgi:glucokinase